MPSFDVVSEVDLQEVRNAVDQANRELATRFDFRKVSANFELTGAEVVLRAGQFAEPVVARRTVGRGRVVVSRLEGWRLRQGAGGKPSDAAGERLHATHYDRLFAWLGAGRRTSDR